MAKNILSSNPFEDISDASFEKREEEIQDIQENYGADERGLILGQPPETFTKDELLYVGGEIDRLSDLLDKSPYNKVFVDELVKAELELRRHDLNTAEVNRRHSEKQRGSENDEKLLKLQAGQAKIRANILTRLIKACEALGVMPKDIMTDDARDASLSDLHSKYLTLLESMRRSGSSVGEVSEEAKELAERRGVDWRPIEVNTAIPEAERDKLVDEYITDKGKRL